MLISPAIVSKFLSDPNEPDYYKAARIVLGLFKHDISPGNTWTTLTGEQGTVIEFSQCQRQGCARQLFICKVDLPINHQFMEELGVIDSKINTAYHLIQQDQGREQTLCTFGYGHTDKRYAKHRRNFSYVSIPILLNGKEKIITDEKYLCGRFNVLR